MIRGVQVRVCATSANLGPGFDSLGLAVGVFDEVHVRPVNDPDVRIEVVGEGRGELATGERHLVLRAVRRALSAAGCSQPPGLELLCRNAIPHGRGLGSSAAAVVAGLLAGRALAGPAGDVLDDARLLALATEFEGHPDNAAAALLGGLTIAWTEDGGPRAVRVEPHPDVTALLLVPQTRLATRRARAVLPDQVSHAAATATAGRAALLVHALSSDPSLLLAGTRDWLHQQQRGVAMPWTLALVDALRERSLAAVVSGAGPSILVLSTRDAASAARDVCADLAGAQWRLLTPQVVGHGPLLTPWAP